MVIEFGFTTRDLQNHFFLVPVSAPVKPDYGPVYATPATLKAEGLVDLLGPYDENKAAYERIDVGLGIKAALARHAALPPMYLTCGTEDYVRSETRAMRDFLTQAKLPFEYLEKPGTHSWPLWRDSIAAVIDFHWRTFQGHYKP